MYYLSHSNIAVLWEEGVDVDVVVLAVVVAVVLSMLMFSGESGGRCGGYGNEWSDRDSR